MTNLRKRQGRRVFFVLVSLLLLCLLAACGSSDTTPQGETDAVSQTAPDSLADTIPETTAAPESESESETEPETEFLPDSSKSPAALRFDGQSLLSYIKTTGTQIELFDDPEVGQVLKMQPTTARNYVVLDYEAYMSAKGLSPISVEEYRFAAITFKTGAGYGGEHKSSVFTAACAAGSVEECNMSDAVEVSYSAKSADWQTVYVDLRANNWSGTLHKLLLTPTFKSRAEEYVCISSVTFLESVTVDMLETPLQTDLYIKGLAEPITVVHITDLHACAYTNEEFAAMTAARQNDLKGRFGLFWGSAAFRPDDVLSAVSRYAGDINADLILATGDIIDFPSEGNLSMLSQFVTASSKPVLFMAGNHDWCFSDDYMTQNAIDTYLPRITALAGAQNGVAVYEAKGTSFITVDNSSDTITTATLEAYTAAVTAARAKGNAVILSLHVPFTADTLVADCKKMWNRNICIGTGGISDWHEPTMALFRAVTEGTELAPDAVISGHVHFSHEDIFPNGVTQIITADASGDGLIRVIRFLPAES